MASIVPDTGCFVGRLWRPGLGGPSVVEIRGGRVFDVTCRTFPTMRDLLEFDDPVGQLRETPGELVGSLDEIVAATRRLRGVMGEADVLLAPFDLQAVKACGVTFAGSMVDAAVDLLMEQIEGARILSHHRVIQGHLAVRKSARLPSQAVFDEDGALIWRPATLSVD